MKKCTHCNDFAIYEDSVQKCPICSNTLVDYFSDKPPVPPQPEPKPVKGDDLTRPVNTYQPIPPFERRRGRHYVYRGTVSEIHPQSRLHSRGKKLVNSIFIGEPYQFGNTSQETIFRVEELHSEGFSVQSRDCVFYGDVEGRFNYGDDVTVTTKRVRDRYIVTDMFLNETNSRVRPGAQIPAGVVRLLAVLALVLAVLLVIGIISFIAGGGLMVIFSGIISIIMKFLPYILLIAGVYFLIRYLIRGRFR